MSLQWHPCNFWLRPGDFHWYSDHTCTLPFIHNWLLKIKFYAPKSLGPKLTTNDVPIPSMHAYQILMSGVGWGLGGGRAGQDIPPPPPIGIITIIVLCNPRTSRCRTVASGTPYTMCHRAVCTSPLLSRSTRKTGPEEGSGPEWGGHCTVKQVRPSFFFNVSTDIFRSPPYRPKSQKSCIVLTVGLPIFPKCEEKTCGGLLSVKLETANLKNLGNLNVWIACAMAHLHLTFFWWIRFPGTVIIWELSGSVK